MEQGAEDQILKGAGSGDPPFAEPHLKLCKQVCIVCVECRVQIVDFKMRVSIVDLEYKQSKPYLRVPGGVQHGFWTRLQSFLIIRESINTKIT